MAKLKIPNVEAWQRRDWRRHFQPSLKYVKEVEVKFSEWSKGMNTIRYVYNIYIYIKHSCLCMSVECGYIHQKLVYFNFIFELTTIILVIIIDELPTQYHQIIRN